MPDYETLHTGQDVFIKSPLQIHATVTGPSEIGLNGEEIYPVKLHALNQFYRPQDLEPSQQPETIPANRPSNRPPNRLDLFERAHEIAGLIERRAYELFESSGLTHGHDHEHWNRAQSEILLNVPLDIRETETELMIRVEVPGFSEETLEVGVVPSSLCIAGKRKEAPEQRAGNTVYSERRPDQIFRVLDLPSQVNPDRLDVTLGAGILEITMPKLSTSEQVAVLAKGAAA
jgi:HSP20 family protein